MPTRNGVSVAGLQQPTGADQHAGNNITVADDAGNANGTTAELGLTNGQSSTNGVVGSPLTVDQMVSAINAHSSLNSQVKASKSTGGFLSLQNLTATSISVTGISVCRCDR